LSNRRSSEKSIFTSCSVLIDSANIYVCLLIAFFLSSFDHETFEEVATVAYALMGSLLELKHVAPYLLPKAELLCICAIPWISR
jgi:hypothetical protein